MNSVDLVGYTEFKCPGGAILKELMKAKAGILCPHCGKTQLHMVDERPPFGEYLICPICDSTYLIDQEVPEVEARETELFAVVHGGTVFEDTIGTNSKDVIFKFFSLDGCGKYIDEGWRQALTDGYEIKKVAVTITRIPEEIKDAPTQH